FEWPFYLRLRNVERVKGGTKGELFMLDSPRTEDFGVPSPSYLHIYEYEYSPKTGFAAVLRESHALPVNTSAQDEPPNGIIFPSSFDFLPNGAMVVVDLFSLWVTDGSLSDWRMGWTSPDFGLEPYCSTVTHNGEEVP